MHTPIHPKTQLELAHSDAAARQRRAATHRFVHAQRKRRSPVRTAGIIASVVGLALTLILGLL